MEYEDEFGRIRTAPRSEVPRHLVADNRLDDGEEDEDVICKPPYKIYTSSIHFTDDPNS